MASTVAKNGVRTVSAIVFGEPLFIQCPEWCVVDHGAGVFDAEDIAHLGTEVAVGALRARLACWPFTDDTAPYVAVVRSTQALWGGEAKALDAAQVAALGRELASDALKSLARQLRLEEIRQADERLAAERDWAKFMRSVCAGCRVGS